ncbi:TMhelix containing protein [Vibrio phage 1.084.O._10N.261.49.F5]|nr:TMhelix containing protein [Vibrio phage 1.084.O._10N.261.49.F5]
MKIKDAIIETVEEVCKVFHLKFIFHLVGLILMCIYIVSLFLSAATVGIWTICWYFDLANMDKSGEVLGLLVYTLVGSFSLRVFIKVTGW